MLPGRAQVTASSVRHQHGASAPSERRLVVDHDDAVKTPDVVVLVPLAGAMHRAAIVRHQHVAWLPAILVGEAVLIDQTANEIVRCGLIEITATGLGGAPTTMMFRNKTVATKVPATLTEMGADGSYDKLFDKFGLTKAPSKVFAIRGPGPQ